jgi:hypothetical protein
MQNVRNLNPDIIEPEFKKLRSGSWVKGSVWISDIALGEIVKAGINVKSYQRKAFFMPDIKPLVRVFDRIYIPEEI